MFLAKSVAYGKELVRPHIISPLYLMLPIGDQAKTSSIGDLGSNSSYPKIHGVQPKNNTKQKKEQGA